MGSLGGRLVLISPMILSLLAGGLIINVIQAILYLLVRPLNMRLYHRLFYYTLYWQFSHMVFLGEWWGGLEVVCHADPATRERHLGREHALGLLNHRYEIDWLATFAFSDRFGVLGNCRSYSKRSIQKLPIFGWSLTMGGNIFLDRNWEKDREVIGQQVVALAQFPSPVMLMLTAEGTRFVPSKHQQSLMFAKKNGLPELSHHLTPRTKGFTHTISAIRGKMPAVYDCQMLFEKGSEPTIIGLLKGEKYVAHIYINRFPMESLPESEEDLVEWLHKLYQTKDKMSDSFFKTGDFFQESQVKRVPSNRLPRKTHSLVLVVSSCLLIVSPILYYTFQLLLTGSLVHVVIMNVVVAVCSIFVFILIQMTQAAKGSSYGYDKSKSSSGDIKKFENGLNGTT